MEAPYRSLTALVGTFAIALSLTFAPAPAFAGGGHDLDEVETPEDAVTYLGSYYRTSRRWGGIFSIVAGSTFSILGALETADVTSFSNRDAAGPVMIAFGAGTIGAGLFALVGPSSDAEIEAYQLAAADGLDDGAYVRYLERRAGLARRERRIGGPLSIAGGVALITTGIVYDFEDNGYRRGMERGFFIAGGFMLAGGISNLVFPSTEERLAERVGVEPLRPRNAVRLAPLVTRHRGETYAGLQLSLSR